MTNTDTTNPDWWMTEYCRKYREHAFETREGMREIRRKIEQDGNQLPEGWGQSWWEKEGEDWWLDEHCRDIRDLMFAVRDGNEGGEALERFLQKWYP